MKEAYRWLELEDQKQINLFDHKVTVKFKEEEYQIMVEYAETHNLSISQLIRMGVELQMKQQANQ